MSSILKALKRLEHENAQRKPEFIRIDAEILKTGTSKRFSSLTVIIAACAVFASGGIAAYLLLKREQPPVTAAKPQPTAPATAAVPAVAPATPSTGEAARPENRPAPAVDTTVEKPPVSPQPTVQRQQTRIEKSPVAAPQAAAVPDQPPVPAPVVPVVPAASRPAVIKLDGIAFQDGGADSLAVVNGVTVSKGSVIEGARVEEIQRDRVRFSRGGERFEVILDKSN